MEKILLIGSTGFLGKKLRSLLASRYEIIGTGYSRAQENNATITLDITNPENVKEVIEKINPGIVILAAALADMDRCETDKDLAIKINVTGVKNVVNCCLNRVLVHYSSDAVFDGIRGNYHEDDTPNPVNFYGETKLRGEQMVKTLPNYLILRTCFIYSDQPNSPKFIPWLIRNLSQGKKANVATDLVTRPTLIDDLAKATLLLLQKKCRGTYHVAGASALSCYQMAIYIVKRWGFDQSLVRPVKRAELPWKAPRGEHATLNIDKLRAEGITMSTFEQGIEKIWPALQNQSS